MSQGRTHKMNLEYKPAVKKREQHHITIDGNSFSSATAKEIIKFALPLITDRYNWQLLKEAVRLGEPLILPTPPKPQPAQVETSLKSYISKNNLFAANQVDSSKPFFQICHSQNAATVYAIYNAADNRIVFCALTIETRFSPQALVEIATMCDQIFDEN